MPRARMLPYPSAPWSQTPVGHPRALACAPCSFSSGRHPNTTAGHDQTPSQAHTRRTNRTESDPSKSPGYHASLGVGRVYLRGHADPFPAITARSGGVFLLSASEIRWCAGWWQPAQVRRPGKCRAYGRPSPPHEIERALTPAATGLRWSCPAQANCAPISGSYPVPHLVGWADRWVVWTAVLSAGSGLLVCRYSCRQFLRPIWILGHRMLVHLPVRVYRAAARSPMLRVELVCGPAVVSGLRPLDGVQFQRQPEPRCGSTWR